MKNRQLKETIIKTILLSCAFISVLTVIFITFFIFQKGLPLFQKVSLTDFIFSIRWEPSNSGNPGYGIFSFILGSLYITFIALLFGVPIGLACAIFLAEIARGPIATLLRRVVELLAGIPSVVYGFFGVVVVCSFVRETFGGTGYSLLSGAIILAIMILPTIINISEVSIRSVSHEYRENSYALGGTLWQTITKVLLPASQSGIITSIVLGTGRAIGETIAVLMVAGNAPILPKGLTAKVRTLTMNIATDMSYASGDHMTSLFTTSIVLFVFIILLNISIYLLTRKTSIQR